MIRRLLRHLRGDDRGAVIIETAIIAPVLAIMSIAGFQVSQLVARQQELQTGADDAASIALAGWKQSTGDTGAIEAMIMRILDLSADEVTIVPQYRCGVLPDLEDSQAVCASNAIVTTYLNITLNDTYTPMWADFGIGHPISFNVTRQVLVS